MKEVDSIKGTVLDSELSGVYDVVVISEGTTSLDCELTVVDDFVLINEELSSADAGGEKEAVLLAITVLTNEYVGITDVSENSEELGNVDIEL